jgi:prophage DNA circulation protein
MSESKAPQGKAVPKLVKAYGSLVTSGDEGVRAWYRLALGTPVRDFEATIVEAKKLGEVRGITKNSAKFVPVIVRAFDIVGADKVSVIEICKVAETAQRALKADGALALAGLVTDWDDFVAKAEKALEDKPKRNNTGAGRKAGEVEESLNADGVILRALEALQEMDDLTLTNFDGADSLVKLINASVANSRKLLAQSVERHPAKGGLITPAKGGAFLDIEELGKRVKASA